MDKTIGIDQKFNEVKPNYTMPCRTCEPINSNNAPFQMHPFNFSGKKIKNFNETAKQETFILLNEDEDEEYRQNS